MIEIQKWFIAAGSLARVQKKPAPAWGGVMKCRYIFSAMLGLCTIYFGCTQSKMVSENVFIADGYYFIVQIQEIEQDTIFYETIEIYSTQPILDIPDSMSLDKSKVIALKLPLNSYSKGYLKGIKKGFIGKVLMLYTNPNRIANDYFVNFDYVDFQNRTSLENLFRLGECK